MCLNCFAQLVYEELEYAIKYGKSKDTYFLIHYKSAYKRSQRAFKIKD